MSRRSILVLAAVAVAGTSSVVIARAGSGSAPPPYLSYAAKFTCGEFAKTIPGSKPSVPEGPVAPGSYQTSINIHNPAANVQVQFAKKAVLLYAGSKPVKATVFERPMPPGKLIPAALQGDFGMVIDCQDIRAMLLAPPASPPAPTFIEGWVVLQVISSTAGTAPLPLDVTGLYTAHGYNCTLTASGACGTITRDGFTEELVSITPTLVNQ